MFKTTLTASLGALAAGGVFAQSMSNPTVGGAPMMADMTIAQNASNAPNLTTLVAAVSEAGLVDTLSSEGPFTVFAPTNDAFGMIKEESLNTLLQPEYRA